MQVYDGYEALKVVREGLIVTVTFNRPEVRNATNAQMHQELARVFPEIGRDPDAHVVILTGAGESFSAGGDLDGLRNSIDDHARWIDFPTSQDRREISVGSLKQGDEKVLDLDVVVSPERSCAGSGLEGTAACIVQTPDKRLQLYGSHVISHPLGSSSRDDRWRMNRATIKERRGSYKKIS